RRQIDAKCLRGIKSRLLERVKKSFRCLQAGQICVAKNLTKVFRDDFVCDFLIRRGFTELGKIGLVTEQSGVGVRELLELLRRVVTQHGVPQRLLALRRQKRLEKMPRVMRQTLGACVKENGAARLAVRI